MELSQFLSQQSSSSYRVTAMNDPVPRYPPHIFGYVHTSPEYWIHDDPLNPDTHDISVIYGYNSGEGNAGQGYQVNEAAHKRYFGDIASCLKGNHDPSPWRRDLGSPVLVW